MHRDVYQCVEMYKKVYKCIQMYTDVNKSIKVRNTLKGCIFFGDSQYNHPFSVFPENATKNASRKIPFVNARLTASFYAGFFWKLMWE